MKTIFASCRPSPKSVTGQAFVLIAGDKCLFMNVPKWKCICALDSCKSAVGSLESCHTKTTFISPGTQASCTVGIKHVALNEQYLELS